MTKDLHLYVYNVHLTQKLHSQEDGAVLTIRMKWHLNGQVQGVRRSYLVTEFMTNATWFGPKTKTTLLEPLNFNSHCDVFKTIEQ